MTRIRLVAAGSLCLGLLALAGCGLPAPEQPPVGAEARGGGTVAPPVTTDPGPGATTGPGPGDLLAERTLTVGQCFLADSTSFVEVVPCSTPHDREVYHRETLDGDDYPGESSVRSSANTICVVEFADFVGVDFASSDLEVFFYGPDEVQWSQVGFHDVLCYVNDPDDLTVGTLRGAAR